MFDDSCDAVENGPLQITITTLYINFDNSTKKYDEQLLNDGYYIRKSMVKNCTDLVYPLISNIQSNETRRQSSENVNIARFQPAISEEINNSTEYSDLVSTNINNINFATSSNMKTNTGFSSSDEKNSKITSVKTVETDIDVTTFLTQFSEANRNGSVKDDHENHYTDSEYPLTENINFILDDIERSTESNISFSNTPDSEYTKMSVTTNSLFNKENHSMNLPSSTHIFKFLSTKDILYFSFVFLAIIILIMEGKRRRKTSRQLRNFFSRLKNPFK
ncbi:hypothetical protein RF11_03088 [Thelohanellus kitauei]|uniref:Uncharacterized protein n=1 Tax=Thelohanellus kitauei TaxID=669202 RepID=A0A0C2IWL7_THEKT|nr:hypothetical protein RF11_03088 [Thelohanellus kitauei]